MTGDTLIAEWRPRRQVEDVSVDALVPADDAGGFIPDTGDEKRSIGIQFRPTCDHIGLDSGPVRLLFAVGKYLQLCNLIIKEIRARNRLEPRGAGLGLRRRTRMHVGQIQLRTAASATGLVERFRQLPVNRASVGEDVYPPLALKSAHISKKNRRLCRVKRFHNVDVAIAGILGPAIVAKPPPLHDLPEAHVVLNVPGAHFLNEVVVCWMVCHLPGVHA